VLIREVSREVDMSRAVGIWIMAVSSLMFATAAWAEDAREAIEAQNQVLITAMLAADAQAVGDLYTDDAVVFAPGAKLVTGRASIVAFWQGSIDAGIKALSLKTVSFESVADLGYEDGVLRIVGADEQITEARYVVVWKRVKGSPDSASDAAVDDTDPGSDPGSWKLHRDIWNSR
jgi:ketosteroid isomerase-like protein